MLSRIRAVLIAVAAFALGVGATLWYQEPSAPFGWNDDLLDDLFDDRFFSHSRQPFAEMERLRNRLNEHFDLDSSPFESKFDRWFQNEFGDYPPPALDMREDEERLYYVIEIGDSELANIDVQVENERINIEATIKSSGDGMQSVSKIGQQFPLPDRVDPATVDVKQRDGKIEISLEKKKRPG